MTFTQSTSPHFVVTYFPNMNATNLKIPKHISVELPEYVTLTDKYKNTWQVKARKVDGRWYLMDGWDKFVADNSVTSLNMLVLNVSSPGSLDVEIRETNGDVKKGVGYRKIDPPKEHLNMESEDVDTSKRVSGNYNKLEYNNRIKAKGKMENEVVKYHDDNDEYEGDDDFAHNGGHLDCIGEDESDNNASGSRKSHHKKRNANLLSKGINASRLASKPKRSYSMKRMKPLSRYRSNKEKEIWNKVSEDEDEDDSECESIDLSPQNDEKGKRLMKRELRADVGTFDNENPYGKRRNVDFPRKNRPQIPSSPTQITPRPINEMVYDDKCKVEVEFRFEMNGLEKARIPSVKTLQILMLKKNVRADYIEKKLYESGEIPRPERIYFITKMHRRNELYIPKHILKDRNVCLPEEITLVDPSGDKYKAILKSWVDERTVYRKCNTFSIQNRLTENDFCICEFGEENKAGFLFISILRQVHS